MDSFEDGGRRSSSSSGSSERDGRRQPRFKDLMGNLRSNTLLVIDFHLDLSSGYLSITQLYVCLSGRVYLIFQT